VLNLSTLRAFRGPFGVIGTLELMIPCCFSDEFVRRRRCVVRGQMILAHHVLIRVELESRPQLESCDAVPIDGDQVQPADGNRKGHLLDGTAVSATKQKCLSSVFR
jgi:hypothetical protein